MPDQNAIRHDLVKSRLGISLSYFIGVLKKNNRFSEVLIP